MTEEQIARIINAYAAEQPSMRSVQSLKDSLSSEAIEMLRALLNDTMP